MQKRDAPAALAARRGGDDFIDAEQRLAGNTRVMPRRLRTVGAVFGTAAGLDRQQGRQLDRIGSVVLAVHLLGAEQQIVERQREQRLDRIDVDAAPGVTAAKRRGDGCSFGEGHASG